MTHGRIQTMTQGREGISLAHKTAQRLMRVARRLSVVAAMFVIAALVAGTAGTSYAKPHHKSSTTTTLDTVSVTNFGAAFGGSLSTFGAGTGADDRPMLHVTGVNTLLNRGTGPAGVSVDSLDDHIAVSVPIDLIDLTGFGGFPSTLACTGAGTPVPCCTGALTGVCAPGTGFIAIFSPGANKNSAPENIIGTPNVTLGVFNTSAVDTAQAVAFEDPFDGVNRGHDIVAVGNTLPFVIGPDNIPIISACAAFGGATVGTITEYDRTTLQPGINSVVPFNNSPVTALDDATMMIPGPANATIGGCLTFLLGPVGLAFDQTGFLFAVNGAASNSVPPAGPGFVTVYQPGAFGDAFPFAAIGLVPGSPTAAAFVNPVKVAVSSTSDFNDDVMYVTDIGDNSVKVFDPFTNFDINTLFFEGTQIATIKGGSTKFNRPEGIALSDASGALYVVNNMTNSFEMFTDIGAMIEGGGGNLSPTLIVKGRNTKLNFPVDVALPNFTPTPVPTYSPSLE